MTSFYSEEELLQIGFKSVGRNVKLSRKTSIYGASSMTIGDNVRIDDFCILSGEITLHSHIHISAYVALYGAMGIELEDYTGISPKSTIFSAMDDFSGEYLIGPIHPKELTNVTGGKVTVCKYSQIGTNCVVFPNINIAEGSVIGAMSLVNKSTEPWTINVGIPTHILRSRKSLIKYAH
ncbi:MAG: acyltransferase [Muribaculum sp.]|nr:acyltransferase [Muribaculum sp.]